VVKVTITDAQKLYTGSSRNAVDSKTYNKFADFSFTLEVSKNREFQPFAGMLVDVKTENGEKEAIVVAVRAKDKKNYDVTVSIAGKGARDFLWPSSQIDFCGAFVKTRECNNKSTNPVLSGLFVFRACFTGAGLCEKTFLPEDGSVFKRRGNFAYGWERDNRSNLRCTNQGTNLNDKCNILFPDHYNPKCSATPHSDKCQPNRWSIEVPNGDYTIIVAIRDELNKAMVNLQANSAALFTNKMLVGDTLRYVANSLQVFTSRIELTDDCTGTDCDKSWSRISSIEILQNLKKTPAEKKEPLEPQKVGLAMKLGGDCYLAGA